MKNRKHKELICNLKNLGSVVVAFSGGVDSTFLLHVAKEALDDRVRAVLIDSPYIPRWEVEEAKELAEELGVRLELIQVTIPDIVRFNPEDRCYLCKKILFDKIQNYAKENGFSCVVDGTNLDDTKDYRPGMVALKELDIKSPLLECEITKNDIRMLSKELGIQTWNKPAFACLLTRMPYGTEITVEKLNIIESAETTMMELGFRAVRVRLHDELARIEVPPEDRVRLFDVELMDTIAEKFEKIGIKYVTLDLKGYRMGVFNPSI